MEKFKSKVFITCLLGVFMVLCVNQATSAREIGQEDKNRPPIVKKPVKGDQSDTEAYFGYKISNPSPGPPQFGPPENDGANVRLTPSTTKWGKGLVTGDVSTQSYEMWGPDEKVYQSNDVNDDYPSMASDSNGNLYLALAWHEYNAIQFFKSTDGGLTWQADYYVQNTSADLREPSVAIGEGGSNGDILLMAYILDDGINSSYPEVATRDLSGTTFTVNSISYPDYDGYARPSLWTDSYRYSSWYAYLVVEQIYDESTDNINILLWRSTDAGTTWIDEVWMRGNLDTYEWRYPDGSWGAGSRNYIVCYNVDDQTLYYDKYTSTNTFDTQGAIYTLPEIPNNDVCPKIEASEVDDTIMVVCTKINPGYSDDNVGQTHSIDYGASWTYLYSMTGYTTSNEFAPELTRCEGSGGGNYHLVYTCMDVYYSYRPQDVSAVYSEPIIISDRNWASHSYPKKAIASNWDTDNPCAVWLDYYDTTYDPHADHIYVYEYIFGSSDFDGNGSDDIAVWRPSQGKWWIRGQSSPYWGINGDIPVNGDYNGDGVADKAVWRPSEGKWYTLGQASEYWGVAGDVPVPGDYDGNGSTDKAVWRPSEGKWWIKGQTNYYWGVAGDIPVPGDYNGDGITDLAVWRPSTGKWWIRGQSSPYWGVAGDIPVPGDYNGDGITDLAVWRLSEGKWYIWGQASVYWGQEGDVPVVR